MSSASVSLFPPTIFHAMDPEWIEKERKENEEKGYLYTLEKTVKVAVQTFIVSAISYYALKSLLTRLHVPNIPSEKEDDPIDLGCKMLESVGLIPVVEEILFRFILQNSVRLFQKGVDFAAPVTIKAHRVFKWLVSPSARIALVSFLFAAVHLTNAPYSGIASSIAASVAIFVFPLESTIYETTGYLHMSILSHMTYNYLCSAL